MAAKSPPIGTLACRIPRASPRSDGCEPVHDGAAARRIGARHQRSYYGEQDHELLERVDDADAGEHDRRDGESEREHEPLPGAVREEAPGQERGRHADRRRCEDDAHLGQREPEVDAELGREHGDAEQHGSDGRLRCSPDRQDDPPVADARHPRQR